MEPRFASRQAGSRGPFWATDALLFDDSECSVTGVQTALAQIMVVVAGDRERVYKKVFQLEGTATAN